MTAPALDLDEYLATFVDIPDDNERSLTGTGQWISHHNAKACEGSYCCIHRPSAHSMTMWSLHLRSDRAPLMERICPIHGTGHPDPDSLAYLNIMEPNGAWAVHGCCGCCAGRRGDDTP